MEAMTQPKEIRIVRPREVLCGLIKEDISQGDEAGIAYYAKAGEKLKEARAQTPHGQWENWVKAKVGISLSTARSYMALANDFEFREALPSNGGPPKYRNLSQFENLRQGRTTDHRQVWHHPVREAMPGRGATKSFRAQRQASADEKHLRHQLGLKLIDIGYRALASKLHPDHGGTAEGMVRLNHVRDVLKGSLR